MASGQYHGNNRVAGSKLQLAEREGDLQVGGSDRQGHPSLVVPTHRSNIINQIISFHLSFGNPKVYKEPGMSPNSRSANSYCI
jgi:hypothetical protein